MTTEIAVLNKNGLAFAADSAVTIGKSRVWKTANKVFSLGPHNDIAIMTHGSGDFVGYSWEVIIKTFRTQVGNKQFETLADCAKAFTSYLRSNNFKNEDQEVVSIAVLFVKQLELLKRRIDKKYRTKIEFRKVLLDNVGRLASAADKIDIANDSITESEFSSRHSALIQELTRDVFQEHIPKAIVKSITALLFEVFRRKISSSYETGIVIGGFGRREFFPSVINIVVDGKHSGTSRIWVDTEKSHDINDPDESEGVVIAFGQDDIAILFLEGIANTHTRWLRRAITKILAEKANSLCDNFIQDSDQRFVEKKLQEQENRKISDELEAEFARFRDKTVIQRIMSVVSTLPKEEMAAMAEALVELTSLRRKMDGPLETVGGPTDVIVISKGDGPIWIKRKHYFNADLNGDFGMRKEIQLRGESHAENRSEPASDIEAPDLSSFARPTTDNDVRGSRRRRRSRGPTDNQKDTRVEG